MPTAIVNEAGIQLSYIDCGSPENSEVYTTVIIIHGLSWSGEIFQKVVDVARQHGLRVVALNRRGYQGSTPLTVEELAQLTEEASLRQFLRDRSLEFAGFLKHLIEDGGIMKPTPDGQGGVVFLGWSLGSVFGLDFIANAPSFPEPFKGLVQSYVKSYILLDPSLSAISIDLPPLETGEQQRIKDTAKNEDALQDWISGWFSYPKDEVDLVKRFIEPTHNPMEPSTWRTEASNPAFMKCYTTARTSAHDVALIRPKHSKNVFAVNSEETLFDNSPLWPGMKIKFAYGENSLWTCTYAGEKMQELWNEKGIERETVLIKNANHFLHWEDPEHFLKSIIPLLN